MSKWADFVITAVRYDKNNEYIEYVKRYIDGGGSLIKPEIKERQVIVNAINDGMTYVTATRNSEGNFTKGAKVEIYSDHYIRTSANSKKRDNLENLPEF